MIKKCILMFLTIVCLLTLNTYAASSRIAVQYVKTSDGDTARFKLDGENIRVRFLGINTPEVSGENKVEEPYGNEALLYTKDKLENAKKIEIEYDDVADKEDRFGRKLAWIWVDDELYELELLKQGLAKTYMLKNDYKYATELKEAESEARNVKVGLWDESTKDGSAFTNQSSGNMEKIKEQDENKMENRTTVQDFVQDDNEEGTSVNSYIAMTLVVIIIFLFLKKKTK